MPVEIDTDLPEALRRLARALQHGSDPGRFRATVARNLEAAALPAGRAVQARVMAIPSRGGYRPGGSIRRAIVQAVRVEALLGPRTTGARISIGGQGMPRQFRTAAKRFNQPVFRRAVYGRGSVLQRGQPYFETTVKAGAPRYQAGCVDAIQDMAGRTARRVR